ncbi:tRNA (N6-threonylcarbamoyladenosine(37)-N6)-methyltransferase TrmO [Alteromonas sp. ASW11-130]|uniref:tRNA (N6-threonylcarbamoyladenosine(37)-N6)-methyltransferase TrmO n=1 Tax=Alteromonas sp. ASW11-130 TaxID=3015775 RepID=UPI002242A0FE|nr:tRNA (N6-threonylcarbamoyladenosine(37)-N6)-methyltransferase TrmO [Alteromonas sp. ASW11-130]MCW8091533.1 tRNA (N6-threonylcarbamoyladenosine(37)-N6)-methyltransferase TrmO [Alteromonas sp. ASW11-130]
MHHHHITPIGEIHTPFQQKFAIPRQPNLANALGQITFNAEIFHPEMLRGIEQFSHLWLVFIFHQTLDRGFKPLVKAPRLGGNRKTGVFASRSTHRPNNLGLSVVKNAGIATINGETVLHVRGVDILHGTPLVDIKPYLPYADCISEAREQLTLAADIPSRNVQFSEGATNTLAKFVGRYPDLHELIVDVLKQDPRPAYKQKEHSDPKIYKVQLYHFDIHWMVTDAEVVVTDIVELSSQP